jgi:hypothetical protein
MINSEYEELARLGELFPAPDEIDRERLRAILVAAGVPVMMVGEEVVDGAASWLYDAWVRYRAYKQRTAGPSRELRQLNMSLMRWLENYTNNDLEGYLLRDKRDTLTQLANETGGVAAFLDHRKSRGKKEHPKTTFLTDIYYLYIAVGGSGGLSDGGPAHCFLAKCTELVDPKMLIPKTGFRQLIQAAIKRREKRGGHPHDF